MLLFHKITSVFMCTMEKTWPCVWCFDSKEYAGCQVLVKYQAHRPFLYRWHLEVDLRPR